MAFHLQVNDGPFKVIFGSPHQLKKKAYQIWTTLTKLSGSAHVYSRKRDNLVGNAVRGWDFFQYLSTLPNRTCRNIGIHSNALKAMFCPTVLIHRITRIITGRDVWRNVGLKLFSWVV